MSTSQHIFPQKDNTRRKQNKINFYKDKYIGKGSQRGTAEDICSDHDDHDDDNV